MVMLVMGIKEGVDIARHLLQEGYPLEVVATNDMCREQMVLSGLQDHLLPEIASGRWEQLITSREMNLLVDASSETSTRVWNMLPELAGPPVYVRYFREELNACPHPLIRPVHSFPEAVDMVAGMNAAAVFLTTGSTGLEYFTGESRLGKTRIVARVLPEWKIIKKCQELGLKPANIVAMQGPFSKRLNKTLFKAYSADVIVSRDSGPSGGADTKISAALELNIPVVLIRREINGNYITACGMPQLMDILQNIGGEM